MIRDLFARLVASVGGAGPRNAAPSSGRAAVESLRAQLDAAPPQRRPQLFNRLGDALARADDRAAAMQAYGKGIDGYLENGFFDAAAALCRKVVEYEPRVVRARCTLAFLLLGKELLGDAEREIRAYVEAARAAGAEPLAIARLRQLSGATNSLEIRALVGEMLLFLGDEQGADRALHSMPAERAEILAPPMEEQRERWARLLRVPVADLLAGPGTASPSAPPR